MKDPWKFCLLWFAFSMIALAFYAWLDDWWVNRRANRAKAPRELVCSDWSEEYETTLPDDPFDRAAVLKNLRELNEHGPSDDPRDPQKVKQ